MRPQTLVPAIATLFLACGNTTGGTGSSALPGADAGTGARVASAGGRSGSSGASSSGGTPGSGGATPGAGGSSTGGTLGAGGAAIDCSNVGRAAPPLCREPCGSPCGCCPCADGERSGPSVCIGGCFAPASDAGTACNPKTEEHRRRYLESPDGCAAIRFTCVANTTVFFNPCGCGCEQRATCPEAFDCQPGAMIAPCDLQQIQTDCPYSDVLQ